MNERRRRPSAGPKHVRSLFAATAVLATVGALHVVALGPSDAVRTEPPRAAPRAPAPAPAPIAAPAPPRAPLPGDGGGTLWGVSSGSPARLFTIDPATGLATQVADVGNEVGSRVGAAILENVLYASDMQAGASRKTVSVNFGSGDPADVSDQGGAIFWEGMAADTARGVLYALDARDGVNVLRTLTPDGTIQSVGAGTGIVAVALAYDGVNDLLYAINETDDSLYTIDVETGTAQLVGDTGLFIFQSAGLAFDEGSGTLYLNRQGVLYTVDAGTGVATPVGSNMVAPNIDGLAFQPGPGDPDPCVACPCPSDADRDGIVGFSDVLMMLASWGPCPPTALGPPASRLVGIRFGNPSRLYDIDALTGEATLIVELNGGADNSGLAYLGDLFYGSDLFGFPEDSGNLKTGSIDESDGTITFVSDQDGSFDWRGLAANDTDGVLYAVDLDGPLLYTLTPEGVHAIVGSTTIDGFALAYDDGGGVLYATHSDDQLYTIDTATGAASLVGPLNANLGTLAGLAYDEALDILYLNIASDGLYTVDTATGNATFVGANNVTSIDGLAWAPDFSACEACPCPADVNRDELVGFADVLQVLANWGACE